LPSDLLIKENDGPPDGAAPLRKDWGANHVVLNVRKLDSLRPADGQVRTEYWDASLPGFGVRVASSGRKTFTVRYSLHGKQHRKDLGIYGMTIGLADARIEAARILTEAANGRDPDVSAKILKRAGITDFKGLCERFLEERLPDLREATAKELTRIINVELIPAWGERDPNTILADEVDPWARGIANRAPYVANRCFEFMRLIYNHSIKRRLLRYTPFIGLERPHAKEVVRSRTFRDDEVKAIFNALRTEPKQMAGLWILLFLTGNRLRETLKSEWAWVSDRDKYMVLPKTVTKNARDHLVPLVPTAVKVLEELRTLETRARDAQGAKGKKPKESSQYVLPGPGGAPMHWAQKSAERVWAESGLQDARLHDIRRTVSTGLAKLGIGEEIIERVLNHTRPGQKLARTYNTYQYIPEKRAALQAWERELRRILGFNPVEVLRAEREGYQGKGSARRGGRRETWANRRLRLQAAGRDLAGEHRAGQRRRSVEATIGHDAQPVLADGDLAVPTPLQVAVASALDKGSASHS
jgi:integrase